MKNGQSPKYPMTLFFCGIFTELIVRRFYLFLPAMLFAFIGIFVKPCVYLSFGLLLLDLVLSLVSQLRIRYTVLHDDDPNFSEWRDAMLSDDWQENVRDQTDKAIRHANEDPEESEESERSDDTDGGEKKDNTQNSENRDGGEGPEK